MDGERIVLPVPGPGTGLFRPSMARFDPQWPDLRCEPDLPAKSGTSRSFECWFDITAIFGQLSVTEGVVLPP
jgi:hypothetical protein